jgi:hypothetical protein
MRNTAAFPEAPKTFCFRLEPPIVLSHWDWGHWSSAGRDSREYERTWIVPRQARALGIVHAAFHAQVRIAAKVLVWPGQLNALGVGEATIVKCTGPAKDRDAGRLALIAETARDAERVRILSAGDAGYDHVPAAGLPFTDVVVPHHGGRTRSTFVPTSDGRSCGRLVYSCGAGNSYDHPFATVVQQHTANWPNELRTTSRDGSGLGHVHLYWRDADPNADPDCRARNCQLTCHPALIGCRRSQALGVVHEPISRLPERRARQAA